MQDPPFAAPQEMVAGIVLKLIVWVFPAVIAPGSKAGVEVTLRLELVVGLVVFTLILPLAALQVTCTTGLFRPLLTPTKLPPVICHV